MSKVIMSEAGASNEPSPAIWKDCPLSSLNEDGQGWFVHEDFLGTPLVNTTITSALLARCSVGKFANDGDDDTVLTSKAAEQGGYLDIETDGDDNDAFAFFTEPFAEIVLNSGNKVWFEARFEVGALADQGMFLGFVEEAGQSRDVIADNCAALIGESLLGFQNVALAATAVFDAVMKLDAGTVVKMDDAVHTAAADTEVKLGLRFDGRESIEIFVNGAKVSTYAITASTFPDNVKMCAIACIKTGTAAAQSWAFDWFRAAYQTRR